MNDPREIAHVTGAVGPVGAAESAEAADSAELTFPRHAPLAGFGSAHGELLVGGVPLQRLTAIVGRTPYYAYSRAALSARVAQLRARLPAGIGLHYAMKANPMPAVVHHMACLVDGIDVASAAEMRVALDAGAGGERISFAGPGKSAAEIAQAVAAGVAVIVESEQQYEIAIRTSEMMGLTPRMAIRINPSFELRSSGMRMGGGAKPFGIDEERVPSLIRQMQADGISPVGLHLYAGSQSLNAEAIIEAQQQATDLAIRLACDLRHPLEWLNLGGGFGVPYFSGDRALDVDRIGLALEPLVARVGAELHAPVVLELGRYLVAEAGIYVCRVIDRKLSHGQLFVITDGGLHHNLAASGNFGQVLRKNYPLAIGNRIGETPLQVQSVVGPLCTPLDLLGDRIELPASHIGDLVVVFLAGAYGPSASPTAFLSHPPPAEALV